MTSYLLRKRVKFTCGQKEIVGELVLSNETYIEVRTCLGVRAYNRKDIGPIEEVDPQEAVRLENNMRKTGT